MPRSPQDLYARLLSRVSGCSTHGYPLWTPEPSREFLMDRPEGLRIGDVGVVIPDDGGFDALFNLCLPKNHCFHRYGVPDSFTCFRPEQLEIRTLSPAEPHGRVILTPSVTPVGTVSSTEAPQRDESGVSTYQFNISSDEGALLILPEGAERHELLNDGLFVEQASQNGAEWYNYAVRNRRRSISQDALYVITGLYKTRSWSGAAFENVAGNEHYAAHYKYIPDRNSTAPMYGWETTRASLHWRAGTSIDYVEPNQTVFIRGLKIALRTGFLGSKRISIKADTPSKARSHSVKWSSVVSSNSRMRDGLVRLMGKGGGSTSRTTMHTGQSTDVAEEQAQSNISDQGGHESIHVEIQRVPNVPPAFHPSDSINRYLLRKDPSANIAITCDSVWMSILEDKSLTTEEFDQDFRLEIVLSQNYDIISHEGVVRLERKRGPLVDKQKASSPQSDMSIELNNLHNLQDEDEANSDRISSGLSNSVGSSDDGSSSDTSSIPNSEQTSPQGVVRGQENRSSVWTRKYTRWKNEPAPAQSNEGPSRHAGIGSLDDLSITNLTSTIKRRRNFATYNGSFGDVWECDLLSEESPRKVAVKAVRTKLEEKENHLKKLRRELRIWWGLDHRNIVPLLGVVSGFGYLPGMVSLWFSNGSLQKYLTDHHMLHPSERRCLLRDIATGMSYLHSQGVIHGDLHSGNVLIDDDGTACLTDFDLSFVDDFVQTSYLKSSIWGNVVFADPALVKRAYESPGIIYPTKPCDVYSFGGLMLHVLSGKKPYDEIHLGSIYPTVMSGKRPQIPINITSQDELLIRSCWDHDERNRPSAVTLLSIFSVDMQHKPSW